MPTGSGTKFVPGYLILPFQGALPANLRSKFLWVFLANFLFLSISPGILRAFASSSTKAEVHLERGSQFLEKELYTQAASEFQQAVLLDPKSFGGFYNLGLAYWKLRKIEPAAEAFQMALSLNPADANSHYYLGRINLLKVDTSKANSLFEHLTATSASPVAYEH